MRYLVVVAHPDDEVLGAGATINKLIENGHNVAVVFMASKAEARKDLSDNLKLEWEKALSILGVNKIYTADFPNIKMNTIPHLDLVRFIEDCICDWKTDALITHHPADVNNDHVVTSYAVQAACRLFQRRDDIKPLKKLLFMEIPSSTDWSIDSSSNIFRPNFFVEIGKKGIDIKLNSLAVYSGVMRKYPHPRSREAITGLLAYRGAQSGCNYAEAFECVYMRA